MRKGNPEHKVYFFTYGARDDETAETIAHVAQNAVSVAESTDDKDRKLFSFAVNIHKDPSMRKEQYLMLLQVLQANFGPKDTEEFAHYFDTTLTLN